MHFFSEFALVIGNAFRGGGEEMELRLVLHIDTHISALFRNTVPLHMCSPLSKYPVICVAAALYAGSAAVYSHSPTVKLDHSLERQAERNSED